MKKKDSCLFAMILLLFPCLIAAQVEVIQNGNVGIGTDTPESKLQIIQHNAATPALEITKPAYSLNNLRFTSTISSDRYSQISIDGAYNQSFRIELDPLNNYTFDQFQVNKDGGVKLYYIDSDDRHHWYIEGQEKMLLNTNGYLGLGVSSPNAILHIKSTVPYGNNLKMESGGNSWSIEKGQPGYSTQALSFVYNGTTRSLRLLSGTDAEFFSTRIRTNSNTIFVDPAMNYNVGFGSAAPAADTRVHISGKSNSSGTFSFRSDSQLGLFLGMAIRDDGKVGMGLTDMSAKLHVRSGGTGPNTDAFIVENTDEDDLFHVEDGGNIGIGTSNPTSTLDVVGDIKASGTVSASCGILSCSDVRYKKDFKKVKNSIAKIKLLDGYYYNWKQDAFPEKGFDGNTYLGFKAQQVEKQLPEIVYTDEEGYKSVDYSRMSVVLVEAMKEQQEQIVTLQRENEILKNQMAEVLKYIDAQPENINATLTQKKN